LVKHGKGFSSFLSQKCGIHKKILFGGIPNLFRLFLGVE
jgi:hypothetical protein